MSQGSVPLLRGLVLHPCPFLTKLDCCLGYWLLCHFPAAFQDVARMESKGQQDDSAEPFCLVQGDIQLAQLLDSEGDPGYDS